MQFACSGFKVGGSCIFATGALDGVLIRRKALPVHRFRLFKATLHFSDERFIGFVPNSTDPISAAAIVFGAKLLRDLC